MDKKKLNFAAPSQVNYGPWGVLVEWQDLDTQETDVESFALPDARRLSHDLISLGRSEEAEILRKSIEAAAEPVMP